LLRFQAVPHDRREGGPTIGAEPPPITVAPRVDRWPAIRRVLLAVAAAGAVGMAVAAVLSSEPGFALAGWIFATLPIGYLVGFVARRGMAARVGIPAAAALAIGIGAATVVAVTSCDGRLEPQGDLAGCDLRTTDLVGLNLSGADLSGADLSGANLQRTILDRAILTGANLRYAGLEGTSLRGAYLDGANLRQTDLTRAILRPATMAGALLDGANLETADLAGVSLRAASLRGANLAQANLTGSDLSDARLDGAILDGAILIESLGLDDAALVAALGVADTELAAALSDRVIRLERRDAILGAVSPACEGRAVGEAGPYPHGDFHPMVILDADGKVGPDSQRAADLGWEPMAVRFTQLVACVGPEEEIVIQACPYQGGGSFGTLTRVQLRRDYRVVEAATGRTVLDEALEGSPPKPCPPRYVFSPTNLNERVYGSDVEFAKIEPDLAELVGR
jgi:uncharacterized protein YjbI with pentapeptide repeats